MKTFFSELKRRNVVKVALAYVLIAWVLIQAADILLPAFNAPEGLLQGFYILLGLLFPLVLFFSWAFEVTPEGVKKTAEVDKSKSLTHGTGQKINKLIGGALVLTVAFIVYDKMIAGDDGVVSEAEASQASIAVLPFVNMSNDPDQVYFSDGISEELLNLLAKIPEMKVAGRTSSFAYKGQNPAFSEIGETLGVAYVLEGSVRKQGNTVRITAQLIRANDGFHMWSETYDRQLDDVFAIQDEIAAAITFQLRIEILGQDMPSAQVQNVSTEAHNLYLLGLQRLNQAEFDTLLESRDYFRRAFEASPGYMDALWGYGLAIWDLEGYGVIDRDEGIKELNKLLNLIKQTGSGEEPLTNLLAANLEKFRGNREASNTLLLKAFAGDPNHPKIIEEMARYYWEEIQIEKALEMLNRALARDPLSLRLLFFQALSYRGLDNLEAGEKTLRRMIEIDPEYAQSYAILARFTAAKGQFAEALFLLIKTAEKDASDPDGPAGVADLLKSFGFYDQADAYLDAADAMSADEVYTISLRAEILYFRGELEAAGDMAEALILSGRESRHLSTPRSLNIAAMVFLETGQVERYKNLILAHVPEFASNPLDYTTNIDGGTSAQHRIGHADELARVYLALGDRETAFEILEAALKALNAEGSDPNVYSKTSHLVLLERYDEAMEMITDPEYQTELRYMLLLKRLRWRLNPLIGISEFDALAAEIDAKLDIERAKIAAYLETGELPEE